MGVIMNLRLEKLRDERNLLKKDIANIIGVAPSVYSEWENEKLSISTKRLYELAELFEVNIDYIVGLTDKRLHIKVNKELNREKVSINLKEIRDSLNMTMRELASKFNVTSSAISNYENNKYLILSPLLIELCKISNYSIDWILGRSKDKHLK